MGSLMTTKQILLSTIIFGTATNIAFAMDHENTEEAIFQNNVKQLSKPIVDFLMNFKTWPKEKQNKIKTFREPHAYGYSIHGCYEDFYAHTLITEQETKPFLDAIDYLKQQQ